MSKQMNIPQLRFPEFKGEWEKKKLGEVAEITTGSTPSTVIGEYYNGNKLFVSPADLQGNRFIVNTKTTLTELGFSKGRKIKKGSVLFVCIGSTIGKVGIAYEECITNQQINSLNAKNGFENNFIYTLLEFNGSEIRVLAGVQAVPQINKTDFSNLQFSFPTLPEQTKIASFLTAVDEKIQALKKKHSLLEQYKKGVMQRLFSSELGLIGLEDDKIKNEKNPTILQSKKSQFRQLRFKDENGKDFPEWEVKKLGEVTYKTDKKNKEREVLPVYSISNVNGFVPQSEQFDGVDSNERGYDTSLYKIIEDNTFVYNPARINVGSIGFSGSIGRVIVSSLYVCFKTNDSVNDLFFNHYLNTPFFRDSVLRKGEGGVRIYLFYENFSEITINLPCLAEQTAIAHFLSALDEKINVQTQLIASMEQWKKGLLQKMFV